MSEKCPKCGYPVEIVFVKDDINPTTWNGEDPADFGSGLAPKDEEAENEKRAESFVKSLGCVNLHLSYHKDIDKFVSISASIGYEEEAGYNRLYSMFKSGYLAAESKYREKLDMAIEALEHIREYWNQDRNDGAMFDACWEAINTADEALKTIKGE